MLTVFQILLFALAVGLICGANYRVHSVIDEINRNPSATRHDAGEDARPKFLGVRADFFPDSKLRRNILILSGFGFAAVLICFGRQFFQ
jgi:hypothetical protein